MFTKVSQFPKLDVVGSIPISRSMFSKTYSPLGHPSDSSLLRLLDLPHKARADGFGCGLLNHCGLELLLGLAQHLECRPAGTDLL